MSKPVFLDPSGRRGRWTRSSILALLLLIFGAAAVFALTIVDVPLPGPLPLGIDRSPLHALAERIGIARHRSPRREYYGGTWLPAGPARGAHQGRPTVSAFYVPWDETSRASLAAHVDEIDQVMPALATVTGAGHDFRIVADPAFDHIVAGAAQPPQVMPMVQNVNDTVWDVAGTATLLHDPAARARLTRQVADFLAARRAAGVVFDFEELPESSQGDYKRFLAETRRVLAPKGLTTGLTMPVADPAWRVADYGRVADKLYLMLYDEHWMTGDPGPIASQPWFVARMVEAVRAVGPGKVVAAIANYGYDWARGHAAEVQTIEEAWLSAHDSEAEIRFDPRSGNETFDYEDEAGTPHHVWMVDAASAWNQLRAARLEGVGGVALWRLGSEDPGVWRDLAAFGPNRPVPDLAVLKSTMNTDVQGTGEILRIAATPTDGRREIAADAKRLIRAERYPVLPTPYVIRRTGYHPGFVSLTFDDGPDPNWTPKILDVLKAKGVPATFFIVGENALAHPSLLNRIVDEGHELGNHSYTHPNMAAVSQRAVSLELNATERLVEAYTGRGMRLFRAPYFGDAEPTTADELGPALDAQQRGYLNVGLHVDTEDWQQPGVETIVDNALREVEAGNVDRSGNIVLLHDGGGNRAETLAALPRLIDALRAKGYRFVKASALAGLTPAQVMPKVEGADLIAVRADVAVFIVLAALSVLLSSIFVVAIGLGVARALSLTLLAATDRPARPPPEGYGGRISVLIPCFNEARVIESSVRRVLASRGADIEVIVVDDGSTDGTAEMVERAFAGDPRFQLLRLPNRGKAHALNRGLALAQGEAIVALDADTQFETATIAKLARWFADPKVGAVAGNAKVGNKVNLVTRWQAVEYVTAQNLERRALARLGAIMVVPGAVGAWRRAALDAVGGFPVDTLAEDQDLTIAVQRAGWRIANDADAVAWTEAPQTLRGLARQRFRWAFGTLQCLWKHRAVLTQGSPKGLARIGMPQAWLFQIFFSIVSPLIDLALLLSLAATVGRVEQHGWAQTHTDLFRMAAYWIVFVAIDLASGLVAYRMDVRERRFPAMLLIAQRFVYRQLMYWVVIRAVAAALHGRWVGWGKLERTGRATAPSAAAA
ncbi:MAG: peptidoglycan-N-acetylglucosamine deacetylase [Sphingomonadales bacterium]|jgi:cellulose synthase/poly-beta-1,6-N-acetylglucosamine synthase-like glycosyltransferase/peptidoglycan/xylan/chitin deacetylase (PgdA/CDA1 family)/spore germination protein YaaH|nr:peptidoglycan-N-acetylglucosamine deacetylase [Sphingomonadales bacterium]